MKRLLTGAVQNALNDHPTCFMEIVSCQLKQPQVHVGDGVEGAAGQQHHFSLLLRVFRGHFSQLRSSAQNLSACHQPLHGDEIQK